MGPRRGGRAVPGRGTGPAPGWRGRSRRRRRAGLELDVLSSGTAAVPLTPAQPTFWSFPLQTNRTTAEQAQTPASEAPWERPWSVEEIRRSSQSWSLAADAGVRDGVGAGGWGMEGGREPRRITAWTAASRLQGQRAGLVGVRTGAPNFDSSDSSLQAAGAGASPGGSQEAESGGLKGPVEAFIHGNRVTVPSI